MTTPFHPGQCVRITVDTFNAPFDKGAIAVISNRQPYLDCMVWDTRVLINPTGDDDDTTYSHVVPLAECEFESL